MVWFIQGQLHSPEFLFISLPREGPYPVRPCSSAISKKCLLRATRVRDIVLSVPVLIGQVRLGGLPFFSRRLRTLAFFTASDWPRALPPSRRRLTPHNKQKLQVLRFFIAVTFPIPETKASRWLFTIATIGCIHVATCGRLPLIPFTTSQLCPGSLCP
jgi:hypothetical protein